MSFSQPPNRPPLRKLAPWVIGAMALVVWLMLGNLAGLARSAQAGGEPLPEYAVKSAYLYQFTHFVEWPSDAFGDAHAPFILCVLGEDPFGQALDVLMKKTSQARRLLVQRVRQVKEAESCHVLFISASEKDHVAQALSSLATRSLLTVSDIEGFAQDGGIVEFVERENKIRFAINVRAANKAGIRISSKLLSLALIVGAP